MTSTQVASSITDPAGRSEDPSDAGAAGGVVVNGVTRPLDQARAQINALDFLRNCGLTGAKEGCAEGECGACSVMVARPGDDGGTLWTAINACLIPAASLDGQEVVTSEGLGDHGELHPVQREMAMRGGSQCGYCTPGFVCSMAAEFYRPGRCATTGQDESDDTTATEADHHERGPNGFDLHALSGNLCRCTGYRPIRDAAYALEGPTDSDAFARRRTQPAPAPARTRLHTQTGSYLRPVDLAETFEMLAEHPEAVFVAGSTDWGVDVNIKGVRAATVIGIDRLPELRELAVGPDYVEIGAAITLSEAERSLQGRVPLLAQMFPQFASRLIRNGATFGGNLGTGSPIGDSPPALLALESDLILVGPNSERVVPLADYFTGYRQTVKAPDELIKSIRIPLPLSPITAFHKISKRRFDDISSVAVGVAITVDHGVVSRARIGLGGVAATPIRALATEAALEGRPWSAQTVAEAATVMGTEGTPMDDHRASAAYRSAMLGQSLRKLHAQTPRPTPSGSGA